MVSSSISLRIAELSSIISASHKDSSAASAAIWAAAIKERSELKEGLSSLPSPVGKEYWSGFDSQGRAVQVGRKDGIWFSRWYRFNGYGMSWSKWTPSESETLNADNTIDWGFSKLRYVGVNNRLRFPL
jgi:hypothetical protein